jgi:hypothetical protein
MMAYQLTFHLQHAYNSLASGIQIQVALKLGEDVVFTEAKVDPGAQVCLFRREQGEMLGLEIENGHRIMLEGIAGTLVAYGHSVTVHTLGLEFDSIVYFAESYGLRRNLLGREGWLQKIRLVIVDYDSTIYLSPYDKP